MEDSISINECVENSFNVDRKMGDYNKVESSVLNSDNDKSNFSDSEFTNDFVEEYMDKGINLNISIIADFNVPAQHYIETRLSKRPTEEQKVKFEELHVTMKHGPFSKDEDDLIKKNFKYFCKTYDVRDPDVFLSVCSLQESKFSIYKFSHDQRLEFARILARGLNNRYLYSVFYRFRVLTSQVSSKGRYTEDEDVTLLKLVKENSRCHDKFGKVAEILGRGRQSVTKRYYLLTGYQFENNVSWTKELTERFLSLLLHYTRIEDIEVLRNAKLSMHIFVKISRKMGISPTKLRIFWLGRLSSQLFCKGYITLQCIRIKLIKLFRKAKIKSKRDIQWSEVANHFDGLSPLFLYQKFDKLVKHRVPEELRKNFEVCLDYLYKKVIPELKLSKYDRELRRCTYSIKDGLKFITED